MKNVAKNHKNAIQPILGSISVVCAKKRSSLGKTVHFPDFGHLRFFFRI